MSPPVGSIPTPIFLKYEYIKLIYKDSKWRVLSKPAPYTVRIKYKLNLCEH